MGRGQPADGGDEDAGGAAGAVDAVGECRHGFVGDAAVFWGTPMATGAPNVTSCIDSALAWGPAGNATGPQWLQTTYATPQEVKSVWVHETFGAPFVTQVEVLDTGNVWHTVWQGNDTTACGGWLGVPVSLPAGTLVAAVKVTTPGAGSQRIDAVGIDTTSAPVVSGGGAV